MVTIILLFQQGLHLVNCIVKLFSHFTDCFTKNTVQFIFSNTANGIIPAVHADIIRLIKTGKNRNLTELRNTSQKHKAQASVSSLEGTVKILQDTAIHIL